MICSTNQLTGFYMMGNTGLYWPFEFFSFIFEPIKLHIFNFVFPSVLILYVTYFLIIFFPAFPRRTEELPKYKRDLIQKLKGFRSELQALQRSVYRLFFLLVYVHTCDCCHVVGCQTKLSKMYIFLFLQFMPLQWHKNGMIKTVTKKTSKLKT